MSISRRRALALKRGDIVFYAEFDKMIRGWEVKAFPVYSVTDKGKWVEIHEGTREADNGNGLHLTITDIDEIEDSGDTWENSQLFLAPPHNVSAPYSSFFDNNSIDCFYWNHRNLITVEDFGVWYKDNVFDWVGYVVKRPLRGVPYTPSCFGGVTQ